MSIMLDGEEKKHTPKNGMAILGEIINIDGNTADSMEARLAMTDKTIYKNLKVWTGDGSMTDKLNKTKSYMQQSFTAAGAAYLEPHVTQDKNMGTDMAEKGAKVEEENVQ